MDDTLAAAVVAAKSAKRWASLVVVCTVVAVLVLIIDQTIKRDILAAARAVRGEVERFEAVVAHGRQAAGSGGTAADGLVDGGDSGPGVVVDAVPAGKVLGAAGDAAGRPPGRRGGRVARGTARDES